MTTTHGDYDEDYYESSEAQLVLDKLYNGVDGCGISKAVNPIAIINRIVGGDETAANEFPWVVGISFNYREVVTKGFEQEMKLYWIKEEEGLKFHCIIDTNDAVIPGIEPVPDYVCSHFLKKYGSNSNSI